MEATRKSFHLKRHFDGLPKEEDFQLVTEGIPPIADDEFLVEMLYLSVDPYMRPYSRRMKEGDLMIGGGVGRIVKSKNSAYPVGCVVTGPMGWCTHSIPSRDLVKSNMFQKVPAEVNPSYSLGVLGLTGVTAYFGFVDICTPKPGETVLVNTAAGAVGNLVGQIAKALGCHVVGCASSEEKLQYLKEIGFDDVFNYKTITSLDETLTKVCPKGIDIFFDNVGGSFFDTTLPHMNKYGRVSLCGCISSYNAEDPSKLTGPIIHMEVIPKELKIQGFIASTYYSRYMEAAVKLQGWIKEGKIQVREHVVEGFLKMPSAFLGLFQGSNIGKVVVKVN